MIWIIVAIIIAAVFTLWCACALSSRDAREEERRQLERDIANFLKGIKHGN